MVDRSPHGLSRIPVPVKTTNVVQNGSLELKTSDQNVNGNLESNFEVENGNTSKEENGKKDKGFETFLMTGDMIIRTTASPKSRRDASSRNASDSSDSCVAADMDAPSHYSNDLIEDSPKLDKKFQRSAESGFEDQGQLSASSTLELQSSNKNGETKSAPSLSNTGCDVMSQSQSSAASSTISSVSSDMKSDISEQTVILNEGDSGLISPHEEDVKGQENLNDNMKFIDNENSDDDSSQKPVKVEKSEKSKIVTSKSAEKIILDKTGHQQYVRPSKSQELKSDGEFAIVDIDIDDNMAYSLDQIPQRGSQSIEIIDDQVSRSLHNSPEHRSSDKAFIPGFINIDMKKGRGVQNDDFALKTDNLNEYNNSQWPSSSEHYNGSPQDISNQSPDSSISSNRSDRDSFDPSRDPNLLEYQPPSTSVDRPSAQRLAKRLYQLDGFRKSDVSRHLSKKNDFSTLVAEEYLKLFSFGDCTLDYALREFLQQFCLSGETQERERVLAHFSRRYCECNTGIYNSEDSCHTLTCAIMLLNTDLHGSNIGKRMTCSEFIDNLAELNDGENFPKELLKTLYQNIKHEPFEWALDYPEEETNHLEEKMAPVSATMPQSAIGHNPYLDVPDPNRATEFKHGYVMRKCCKEPDKKKTPLGKRGWKMFYASLQDMVLYLYKDQHMMKKGQLPEGTQNAIRVHHSLAIRAADYTKKQHVFRLQTADWAIFLFQTSDSKELQDWIDTINFVSATLSAPALSGGVGSQRKFQRPLLPATYTRFNLREQLAKHTEKTEELEQELKDHRQYPPDKGAKARIIADYMEKESFLEYELKRYKTYVYLIQSRLATYPELEPSLVETVIGEDDESVTVGRPSRQHPVQRSLSDRVESTTPQNFDDYISQENAVTYL
ncbi:PH and SEC7 domain-containing protein-like isoform X1 [Mytilus californianus]|uniref:PH and SEC7 domain-containing protein-like isoform X1 n=1 Tax=Mytilus californianus TaxID=6549 RepID=UPI00224860F6|nr:PH and SEC7 domain-containing protein-like isoform X1 [Mytilus californianus]XP_052068704.1 PH and SEC7 domain-containing protein-like isoform X1 [Mytilus californianus]